MDFLNLAKERFSARAFSAQAVEEDKVNYLLECAQRAPSACNKQPWHFVVAQTEEARQKVQQCYNREWMRQAPLYIIIYAANDKAWVREEDGKSHAYIDAAIASSIYVWPQRPLVWVVAGCVISTWRPYKLPFP